MNIYYLPVIVQCTIKVFIQVFIGQIRSVLRQSLPTSNILLLLYIR